MAVSCKKKSAHRAVPPVCDSIDNLMDFESDDRVYRREADNYPTLEEEEIMRAAYPHEPWKKDGKWKRWAKKAFEAWEAIAEKGYIRIIHKRTGMQILPSDSHVRLHHEILKSSEKAQR